MYQPPRKKKELFDIGRPPGPGNSPANKLPSWVAPGFGAMKPRPQLPTWGAGSGQPPGRPDVRVDDGPTLGFPIKGSMVPGHGGNPPKKMPPTPSKPSGIMAPPTKKLGESGQHNVDRGLRWNAGHNFKAAPEGKNAGNSKLYQQYAANVAAGRNDGLNRKAPRFKGEKLSFHEWVAAGRPGGLGSGTAKPKKVGR